MGDDYWALMALWEEFDKYWLDVLRTVEAHGELEASMLPGVVLQFEGEGASIKAVVINGEFSSRLCDWQGKGAYRVKNPGMNDDQANRLRDQLFDRNEFTPHSVVEPVFMYPDRMGPGHGPQYLGARLVSQHLGKWRDGGLTTAVFRAFGASDGFDTGLSYGLKFFLTMWHKTTPIGLGIWGLDIALSVKATYDAPREYSPWPGTIDVNSSIGLDMLPR